MEKENGNWKRNLKRRNKKDNKNGKSEGIILERNWFKKKEQEFWDYVRQFEIVVLVETWIKERSWEKIEEFLPKKYKWEYQGAKRRKKKGRAAGGIITGVKLGIKEKRQKEKGEEEGCMERNVQIGNKWWKIMRIYSKEMKTTRRSVQETMKENKEECLLMGGDFN
jgi:hypothetical protein